MKICKAGVIDGKLVGRSDAEMLGRFIGPDWNTGCPWRHQAPWGRQLPGILWHGRFYFQEQITDAQAWLIFQQFESKWGVE